MPSNITEIPKDSDESSIFELIDNNELHVDQILAMLYILQCGFWLIYFAIDLSTQIRKKKKLITSELSYEYDYQNRLFACKEKIIRETIILIFLCFELAYGLTLIATWLLDIPNNETISIPVSSNCSILSFTFLGKIYDTRFYIVVQNMVSLLGDFAFSMMIWLFGASLFHLSFAARNKLRVKTIVRFIVFGIFLNFIIAALSYIPYTSLFGTMVQSWTEQICFFVVVYIAKKKFFPAMNSRVNDAYHTHNTKVYQEQLFLLKQYKILVIVFLITFELYIFKNIFFFNQYVLFESICMNPCWFHYTYYIPVFKISSSTNNLLHLISDCFLIFGHFIDIIVYFNFIILSLTFTLSLLLRNFKERLFPNKKIRYRYHGYTRCASPLLTAT